MMNLTPSSYSSFITRHSSFQRGDLNEAFDPFDPFGDGGRSRARGRDVPHEDGGAAGGATARRHAPDTQREPEAAEGGFEEVRVGRRSLPAGDGRARPLDTTSTARPRG